MKPNPMVCRRILLVSLSFLLCPVLAPAQQQGVPTRVTQAIDETNLTVLKGNTHPLARPEFDRGPAPTNLPLDRMLLVLQRSPDQEAALQALLDQQQDKASPNYHKWLTPEQFGQQFGPAEEDIQAVASWLESHGFRVNRVAKGRTMIEFSGSAGQLQGAFHTEIHKYAVNGQDHWANASDPQIPSALMPVVAGVKTLHNFYKRPQIVITGEQFKVKVEPGSLPEFTSPTGQHALAPQDYATIYDIDSLYTVGINGTGSTIAVVGRSDFEIQDVIDFRNLFLLPMNTPQVVNNGPAPGVLSQAEELEATLDVTWSGAIAPNAQVIFVASASTNTTDGLDLSEQYIIDNDLGNVMTESFGGCEASVTAAEATAISSLAEQAAAEGITYVVSSGDAGAEGCDNPNQEAIATGPISVNILASTPYTVAVGGTEFNEGSNAAKYWNATNSTNRSSAISYIPEDVWNESCISGCGQSGTGSIFAGAGGASSFFTKPSWQSAVSGIPADGSRDLPDVSLTAAGHDPYLLCFTSSCQQGSLYGVGGTSAATPSFAGIMALVNQKTGSRQGQANYVLYRLAAQETLSKCNASNSSTLPASTCIFNDVTIGNNAVPGELGYGTSTAKYQSTVGYDLATGLGSVNVANLVNGWGNARSVASATTLSINPFTGVTHGTPLDVTINVGAAPPAAGNPTGDVALIGDFGPSLSGETQVVQLTLSGSTANSNSVKQLPGGTYNVQAHYGGDGTFVPSDSAPVQVNILPEPSTETVAALTGPAPNLTPFMTLTYGTPIYLQATAAGKSGVGVPTGTVNFIDSVQGTLASVTLDSTGTATTSSLAQVVNAGSRSVTASYSGDASFQTGTSSAVSFKITSDATATAISPPGQPFVEGFGAQIVVNISANGYGVAPSGTVTGFVGGNQIGNPVPVIGNFNPGNGTVGSYANVPLPMLPPGQSTATAIYSGDTNYQPSNAAPVTISFVRSTSVSVASSKPTIPVGQSVTFTASITPGQTGPAITGTVQFMVNYANSGSPVPVQNGQAQLTTTSLPWGTDVISADYSGDSNYAPSNGVFSETVNPVTTTIAITTSSASIQQSQTVTFTATITPGMSGGPAPTGSVQFQLNGSNLGGAILNASGQATYSTNTLPVGSLTIGAAYLGDTIYSGSNASITETVTAPPTFTIAANPMTISVTSPGQSGSTMLTFTAQDGLTGSATLSSSMCSNLPSESSCSFSPSTVAFTSSTTTVPVTLTLSTQAPSALMPSMRRFMPESGTRIREIAVVCGIGMCLLMLARRWQRRWTAFLTLITFVVIASAAAGCGGGGGSSGPPPPPPNPGTPVGNYAGVTLTVTISGVTQSINNLSVNVQ